MEARARGVTLAKTLDALLLDTIGSVAADAAADGLNEQLCSWAASQDLHRRGPHQLQATASGR